MAESPKFEVLFEAPRNLIRIRFIGHVSAADMKPYSEAMTSILNLTRKGFTLLTDLSSLETMELDCVPGLTKVMDALKARGIGAVVRIIPDPAKDIGFNILSVVHYRRGVRVVTCQTAAEAETAV